MAEGNARASRTSPAREVGARRGGPGTRVVARAAGAQGNGQTPAMNPALRGFRAATPAERASFTMLSSSAATIATSRLINYVRERRRRVPAFRSYVRRAYHLPGGGARVHHYLPGIAALAAAGAAAILTRRDGRELWFSLPFGIGADIPYSRETKSIEYLSKTYTPDFTVDRAGLAIELNVCLDDNREKALPREINDDILAYGQEYGNLLFVIYDTGNIRDVDRFVSNFEEQDNVVVRVVKQ